MIGGTNIVSLIQELIGHINGNKKEDIYIKETLRRYCEMTKKLILSDNDKWDLVSTYGEEIEVCYKALQNKKANVEACKVLIGSEVKKLLGNFILVKDNPLSIDFITDAMFTKYSSNGIYPKSNTYVWRVGSNSNGFYAMFISPKGSSSNSTLLLNHAEILEDYSAIKNDLQARINAAIQVIRDIDTNLP